MRAPNDPSECFATFVAAEVENDALLASIEAREIRVVRTYPMGTDAARDIACRRLDLDDLGAEVGEHQAAIRARQHVADLDDADAFQRTAHDSALASDATTSDSDMSEV